MLTNGRIKRPAYQWYPADADGDEVFRLMTYEQQGIYRALLDRQWVEGSLPTNLAQLAGLLPKVTAARFAKLWPLISQKFFTRRDGRLINLRLENQRKELEEFCKVQAVRSRKGVLAKKLRAKNILTHGLTTGLPKSGSTRRLTSSSSTSSSTKNKRLGAATEPPPPVEIPSATPSVRTETAPEKAPSPAKEFLDWFQAEYKTRRHGATYFVTWDKHMAIIGRLLKLHDPQRLRRHAKILLSTNEDWTETTDRGIEVLASRINWLEERLCAWEAQRQAREPV